VVSPQAKRKEMQMLIDQYKMSQRRGCNLVNLYRSVGRYITHKNDRKLKEKIKNLAYQRKRFGY
jgi:putative transposase